MSWEDYIITDKEFRTTFFKFKFKYKMLLILAELVANATFYFIQNGTLNWIILAVCFWFISGLVLGTFKKYFGNKLYS